MRKIVLFISAMISMPVAFAQQASEKAFRDDPINHPMLPVYVVAAFIVVAVILLIVAAFYLIKILNMLTAQAEKQKAENLGIAYQPKPTLWQKFVQTANASVPVAEEKNIELDHSYDGIKELDNHLPPWWKWLFYGTIGWAAIYIVVFHFSDILPLSLEEYQNEITLAEEQARKLKATQPQAVIDESTLQFTHDAVIIEKGKTVFMNNSCGSCHRNDGGGNTIGPNLTDEYWLHGGDIKSVFQTIKSGVVEKGMPAWGKSMTPEDVKNVTFFVMSLQGTKPPDAKAAQGELFKAVVEKSDSSQVQASL
jgi:cytochrome c oxidase cbb3-type subunit III